MKVSWVLRDTKQDGEELGRKILLVWNIGAIEIWHWQMQSDAYFEKDKHCRRKLRTWIDIECEEWSSQ